MNICIFYTILIFFQYLFPMTSLAWKTFRPIEKSVKLQISPLQSLGTKVIFKNINECYLEYSY